MDAPVGPEFHVRTIFDSGKLYRYRILRSLVEMADKSNNSAMAKLAFKLQDQLIQDLPHVFMTPQGTYVLLEDGGGEHTAIIRKFSSHSRLMSESRILLDNLASQYRVSPQGLYLSRLNENGFLRIHSVERGSSLFIRQTSGNARISFFPSGDGFVFQDAGRLELIDLEGSRATQDPSIYTFKRQLANDSNFFYLPLTTRLIGIDPHGKPAAFALLGNSRWRPLHFDAIPPIDDRRARVLPSNDQRLILVIRSYGSFADNTYVNFIDIYDSVTFSWKNSFTIPEVISRVATTPNGSRLAVTSISPVNDFSSLRVFELSKHPTIKPIYRYHLEVFDGGLLSFPDDNTVLLGSENLDLLYRVDLPSTGFR